MKVGLLTLPLLYNYGAILQAYALHRTINSMGVDCVLIDKELPVYPYYRRPLSILNRLKERVIHNRKVKIVPYWISKRKQNIISSRTRQFVEHMINPKTKPIKSLSSKIDIYDAYVVGSDQVWRKSVVLKITDYLLGFVSDKKIKISYAASFGVDKWEFDINKTKTIKTLLSKFKSITVREESAIELIKSKTGLSSVQVVDPTMLLSKDDYLSLIEPYAENNEIFSYILDSSPEISFYASKISDILGMPIRNFLPQVSFSYFKPVENGIYPSVEEWLHGMSQSKFIVTDSFHGTVFSILFNKPFVVFQNSKRGNTRIESILNLFNLQNRIIQNIDDVNIAINATIEWENINNILSFERNRCIELLKEMLFD